MYMIQHNPSGYLHRLEAPQNVDAQLRSLTWSKEFSSSNAHTALKVKLISDCGQFLKYLTWKTNRKWSDVHSKPRICLRLKSSKMLTWQGGHLLQMFTPPSVSPFAGHTSRQVFHTPDTSRCSPPGVSQLFTQCTHGGVALASAERQLKTVCWTRGTRRRQRAPHASLQLATLSLQTS